MEGRIKMKEKTDGIKEGENESERNVPQILRRAEQEVFVATGGRRERKEGGKKRRH